MTKKSYKNIGIYNIGYNAIKKVDDCESIYIVNPLYLRVNLAIGYIKEKNGKKWLIFGSVDEKKRIAEKIHRCLEWN